MLGGVGHSVKRLRQRIGKKKSLGQFVNGGGDLVNSGDDLLNSRGELAKISGASWQMLGASWRWGEVLVWHLSAITRNTCRILYYTFTSSVDIYTLHKVSVKSRYTAVICYITVIHTL
jgi:hypothetical protein